MDCIIGILRPDYFLYDFLILSSAQSKPNGPAKNCPTAILMPPRQFTKHCNLKGIVRKMSGSS